MKNILINIYLTHTQFLITNIMQDTCTYIKKIELV